MSRLNRVARYVGGGRVRIVAEEPPLLPSGGLLVRTEACGLCSGELMDWYMERKVPHVLGHEVAGVVEASDDARFPVGARVFPHHHAPCRECDACRNGRPVHCRQWRETRLAPGGMAERFAVSPQNLTDTHRVDDLRPEDAALIEPLACVAKSIRRAGPARRPAVIGLGAMGLMHLLLLGPGARGYEPNPVRREHARALGLDATSPEESGAADVVFVCPGRQDAFDFALEIVQPGGTILLFAPLGPGEALAVPQRAYFDDLRIVHAYSCGPEDTSAAIDAIRRGALRAEQVVSDFVTLDELPQAYERMKRGEILKAMVRFGEGRS